MSSSPLSSKPFKIRSQKPGEQPEIEALLDAAFGLDRRAKASYRLREGEKPVPGLSFVATDETGRLVGTISFWDIFLGDSGTKALLLGPLAVLPGFQASGIGQALMTRGIDEARIKGHKIILLVGDAPYYARVGFQKVPAGRLVMPGPTDPQRLLFLELEKDAFSGASGLVRSPSRYLTAPLRSKAGNR